jgi:L-seryl-tRNA(Ser) seleniumtransferase
VPEPEPLVGESLAQGADLLSFSGDKLLGGPQAGIVLGRGDLVARLARHPMMRAFRCDKMTLAALEAVLELYAAPGLPISPVWEACTEERAAARARAGKLLDLVAEQLGLSLPEGGWDRRVGLPGGGCLFEVDTEGRTGSGALPEQDLPGAALALQLPRGLEALHRRLRTGRPALVGQLRDDTLFMDVKALRLEDLPMVASLLARVLE